MIILNAPKLFLKNFNGLAVFPFLFIRVASLRKDKIFLNHEKIHFRQQIELLWIFFFIWYGIEYLIRLVQYKNRHQAYRNISFEREAYFYETNAEYLNSRKLFAFLKFLRK